MFSDGIRSCLCFPLTTAQRQLGALILWSREPNAYSNFQQDFGSLIAAEIAISIDNVLNSAELSRANETLRHEIAQRKLAEEALGDEPVRAQGRARRGSSGRPHERVGGRGA